MITILTKEKGLLKLFYILCDPDAWIVTDLKGWIILSVSFQLAFSSKMWKIHVL